MKKQFRLVLAVGILLATIGVFVRYITHHPALVDRLKHLNPLLLVVLLFLYLLWFLALVAILRVSLRLFDRTMALQENILLNAYSSLLNFFGPGQSGPAMRGVYLKQRHGMRIKDYIFATLLYYGFYAVISAFFLLIGSCPWWQTVVAILAAGAGSAVVIRWYARRSQIKSGSGFTPLNMGLLFAATAAQLILQCIIYYVELRSVQPVSIAQVLSYTGAANFSLFVSITPGAIGIREAFLVFSQHLHHISNSVIIGANLVDRAAYLVFLGLLFVMTLSLHAKDKLQWKRVQRAADSNS